MTTDPTTAAPPAPPPADGPPDGSAAELACPLCRYNLRGLTEPRCPECGFTFQWAELLDAQRNRHPWLFEHGRRDGPRTFLATYVRTCRPTLFWRQVTPANPVHVRRLALYWLVACLPLVATAIPFATIYSVAQRNRAAQTYYSAVRSGQLPVYAGPSGAYNRFVYGRPFGGLASRTQAQVDAAFPPLLSVGFAAQVWDATAGRSTTYLPLDRAATGPVALATVAVVAGWPWLSAAALLIFQASLRRAKVDPAHVLRAACYGCDFGLLLLAVVALFPALLVGSADVARWTDWLLPPPAYLPGTGTVFVTVVICAVVSVLRLAAAYAGYMRFDRPLLTVLASQAVVVLAVATALMTLVVTRR